ncbi:hypothetical protein TPHA_0B03260 [Tetrapisispora phaffii CBS 4417]|uniref:Trafficking protein particle complex III-specific subunit 85 n=1 Tax=Tetrapisispora phaffii (strain ATCC 24235 / CBS 4417 / NBRC 1672 / NRRL Y-8282 / UCD 70-5) TaxID=1071381 RepID=G8BPR7_TETPH|nr:hypothetical protein TPHA_0B03260 [Tetrapisispora phaffii CBS 4417]CCE61998.1 hypothetical protein TPHA_0B03260 [Tetrapisispora phaffii CBS 4417]
MTFTYENYMNLIFHLDKVHENVPQDISKRIVSNAIAPVITVTATVELDSHISEEYGIDSFYTLLRYFGGCISDRDQSNEYIKKTEDEQKSHALNKVNLTTIEETKVKLNEDEKMEEELQSDQNVINPTNDPTVNNNYLDVDTKTDNLLPKSSQTTRNRSRSNSLFQRDSTQSQFIRFTRPIEDLLYSGGTGDMLFDYHTLEIFLGSCLKMVEKYTTDDIDHKTLQKSLYHRFFSSAISSTNCLSPYESFNHPIVSLIAIDITKGQNYELARDLLIAFKNQNTTINNFPIFMSTNDILPVFVLCYNGSSAEESEKSTELSKKIKKQLFAECIRMPLWDKRYSDDITVKLHQPAMSSLDEMLYVFQTSKTDKLPLTLINLIYDQLEILTNDLMIPFMQRKITFWEETILQPKKSLFQGTKLFRKFMGRPSMTNGRQENIPIKDNQGNEYFASTSNVFLLRKLADWSMMISDFKTAYTTFESLLEDIEMYPKYLASCLEWCAVCILMGAQNIVTTKMIKNDVNPLIERSLDVYGNCALLLNSIAESEESPDTEPVRSYETRCMLITSELFLSLSDTWTSTPYALSNLETILSECKLGACSQIMIWERLSDCYNLRTDPRVKHKLRSNISTSSVSEVSEEEIKKQDVSSIVLKGLTRQRKASFFRLLAAKKWAEQHQWRQVSWCLNDISEMYQDTVFGKRESLIYQKLKRNLLENSKK